MKQESPTSTTKLSSVGEFDLSPGGRFDLPAFRQLYEALCSKRFTAKYLTVSSGVGKDILSTKSFDSTSLNDQQPD